MKKLMLLFTITALVASLSACPNGDVIDNNTKSTDPAIDKQTTVIDYNLYRQSCPPVQEPMIQHDQVSAFQGKVVIGSMTTSEVYKSIIKECQTFLKFVYESGIDEKIFGPKYQAIKGTVDLALGKQLQPDTPQPDTISDEDARCFEQIAQSYSRYKLARDEHEKEEYKNRTLKTLHDCYG